MLVFLVVVVVVFFLNGALWYYSRAFWDGFLTFGLASEREIQRGVQ